jgi:hypothetical protein
MSGGGFVKAVFQDTNTFYCTIPHDGAYQDVLEESLDDGVTWNPVTLSKEESDAMLYELCIDNGTPPDKAKKIYEGVKLFGRAAFDADRAAIWGMAKPTKGK